MTAFAGLACDDRDILCDVNNASTYLAEMNQIWTWRQNNYDAADDYCTELGRSASMYTEPPVVHTVREIKAAAYQVKCNRVTNGNIIEKKNPFYLLRKAEQKNLGRKPDKNDPVLPQIDCRTLGQHFLFIANFQNRAQRISESMPRT